MFRLIVNYDYHKWLTVNRKWPKYVYTNCLNQIRIGPTEKCLLGYYIVSLYGLATALFDSKFSV